LEENELVVTFSCALPLEGQTIHCVGNTIHFVGNTKERVLRTDDKILFVFARVNDILIVIVEINVDVSKLTILNF